MAAYTENDPPAPTTSDAPTPQAVQTPIPDPPEVIGVTRVPLGVATVLAQPWLAYTFIDDDSKS